MPRRSKTPLRTMRRVHRGDHSPARNGRSSGSWRALRSSRAASPRRSPPRPEGRGSTHARPRRSRGWPPLPRTRAPGSCRGARRTATARARQAQGVPGAARRGRGQSAGPRSQPRRGAGEACGVGVGSAGVIGRRPAAYIDEPAVGEAPSAVCNVKRVYGARLARVESMARGVTSVSDVQNALIG
eukprot:scaffold11564_cov116-Isochrysis_galbana.AAC.7